MSRCATNPAYALTFLPPQTPQADYAEPNNDPGKAYDLGNASGCRASSRTLFCQDAASEIGSVLAAFGNVLGGIRNGVNIETGDGGGLLGTAFPFNTSGSAFGILGLSNPAQQQSQFDSVAYDTSLGLPPTNNWGNYLGQQINTDSASFLTGPLSGSIPALSQLFNLPGEQQAGQSLGFNSNTYEPQYAQQPAYYQPQYAQQPAYFQPQYFQQPIYYAPQYTPSPVSYNLESILNGLSPGLGGLLSGGAAAGGTLQFGNGYAQTFLDIASGGLTHATVLPSLSLTQTALNDWFKFTITQDGQAGQFANVTFDQNQSHLQIALYSSISQTAWPRPHRSSKAWPTETSARLTSRAWRRARITSRSRAINQSRVMTSSWTRPSPRRPRRRPTGHSTPNRPHSTCGRSRDRRPTGLSITTPKVPDWFAFQTTANGQSGDYVEINFDNNAGDLDLALYNSVTSTTPIAVSETTNNREQVSLESLPAGDYYIKVYGYKNATNNDYTLTINAPQQAVLPDSLQPNNTHLLATNLDDLGNIRNLDNLAVTLGSQEWFRFTLPNTGTSADLVSIDFDQKDGPLQLRLFAADNLQIALQTSASPSANKQMVSLAGRQSGIYYVEVDAYDDLKSSENTYNLHVDVAAPTAVLPTTPTPENAWTIMVYMTVDNLGHYAKQNLIQMQNAAAKLPGNVKIAVLLDQNQSEGDFATGNTASNTGNGSPWYGAAGEAIIQPSFDTTNVATTFDTSMGKTNTGTPDTLASFIAWPRRTPPRSITY